MSNNGDPEFDITLEDIREILLAAQERNNATI